MKILITGGAGFIGSALIRHIISETEDIVLNVDKLTYASSLASLKSVQQNPRYFFEKLDICSALELQNLIQNFAPDAIMHLAAESHVDRSIHSAHDFIQTNIVGTYVLLEAARNYWQGLDGAKKASFRFHHISTDEVFGSLNEDDELFEESSPYRPNSPYSASKASSDLLVRAWHKTYGLPTLISQSSNNYGPYQFPEKLIPLSILNAMQGKALEIYGSGLQIRDWLYVDDHAKALYHIVSKGQIGESYVIGSNNEKRNKDLVLTICKILDEVRPAKAQGLNSYTDLIRYVEDRPGHDRRYGINAKKIRALGWSPRESLEDGLKKTVYWYLDNAAWLAEIQTGEVLSLA